MSFKLYGNEMVSPDIDSAFGYINYFQKDENKFYLNNYKYLKDGTYVNFPLIRYPSNHPVEGIQILNLNEYKESSVVWDTIYPGSLPIGNLGNIGSSASLKHLRLALSPEDGSFKTYYFALKGTKPTIYNNDFTENTNLTNSLLNSLPSWRWGPNNTLTYPWVFLMELQGAGGNGGDGYYNSAWTITCAAGCGGGSGAYAICKINLQETYVTSSSDYKAWKLIIGAGGTTIRSTEVVLVSNQDPTSQDYFVIAGGGGNGSTGHTGTGAAGVFSYHSANDYILNYTKDANTESVINYSMAYGAYGGDAYDSNSVNPGSNGGKNNNNFFATSTAFGPGPGREQGPFYELNFNQYRYGYSGGSKGTTVADAITSSGGGAGSYFASGGKGGESSEASWPLPHEGSPGSLGSGGGGGGLVVTNTGDPSSTSGNYTTPGGKGGDGFINIWY